MKSTLQDVFDLADQIVPPSFDGQIVLQINFSSHETLVGLDDSGFSSVMTETSLPLRSGVFHELLTHCQFYWGDQADLEEYLKLHIAWSRKTFGPGARTEGLIKHIQKELQEIRADSSDVYEWIDVVILALDGAQRALRANNPKMSDPEIATTLVRTLVLKQQINMARKWPDWRDAEQGQPIEHVRGGES